MKPSQRAFTLPELMVSVTILAFLIIVIFLVLDMGVQGFNLATLRQGLQTEAQRVSTGILEDLKQSHLGSVSVVSRKSDSGTFERDGVGMIGLDNWQKPANFDVVTGRPRWNRYVCYYATPTEPQGQLFREEINPTGDPTATDFPPLALGNLTAVNFMQTDPNSNALDSPYRKLADQVQAFTAVLDLNTAQVYLTIDLRRTGIRRPNSAKLVDETLRVQLQVRPENTYPVY